MALLNDYIGYAVSIITNDGRNIIGTLRGTDRHINLILESTSERVFSEDEGVEMVPLGIYIVRGDNIAMVGQINPDLEDKINWSEVHAQPIPPVKH
eukprot:TRINITY_DN7785_c0_g1_i1.p1 TRINITY_DN7785_c0_g1~~TRINITY_DN7785_c0_g1_i1.p1  ORF type:complete len:105 (+),score=25.74 TRINITY_DN7785_c0_g1_i1:28-315(+)